VASILSTPLVKKLIHYAEIFLVAFLTVFVAHLADIFNAGDVNAAKAAFIAALLAAVYAGWDALKAAGSAVKNALTPEK
jgi:hypothetical protein